MKLKDSYFFTIREEIKDEESKSGNLLSRSGMIKKSSNGIYMYLPLGLRVLKNIENIVREEMNNINSEELIMPVLVSEELYEKTGRTQNFGNDVFKSKDRYDRNYILGPTHEEMFVLASSMKIKSYKDLPISLYQIQTKFRDEPRPRYGLIRVREFEMKDAYTFDKDMESLDVSYKKMFSAYKKIFNRLKINYKIVKADTGIMGGLLSEEFQAITDIGEDTIVLCHSCDYASNIEISKCVNNNYDNSIILEKELIKTENAKTIEEISNFLKEDKSKFVKTLIYKIDDEIYALLVNGEDDVNEIKVQKLLNAKNIELADNETVEKITSAKVGFAGPIDLEVKIIIDEKVSKMKNFITGANKTDYHLKNVNLKDFNHIVADIRNIKENDICPKCGGRIHFKKGIEIGNTFKLGTKYSDALNLKYLDSNNKQNSVIMGSYGIGIGRCMAAIVEQNNDEFGIVWPENIAPYKVCIIIANSKDEIQVELANKIYNELKEKNIEVLLDDRDERLGVKLNDMDLIGIPNRVLVGKRATENIVEFKKRNQKETIEINSTEIITKI